MTARNDAGAAPRRPARLSGSTWKDTPHFYKRDPLIVFYVGHSAEVMKPLEPALDAPFASGS